MGGGASEFIVFWEKNPSPLPSVLVPENPREIGLRARERERETRIVGVVYFGKKNVIHIYHGEYTRGRDTPWPCTS